MKTVFRSKIDGGLQAIGLALPCVALLALAATPRVASGMLWLPFIVMVPVALIVVWVVLSTYYEFDAGLFVAHSGPFSWRIPLVEISAVRESSSVRSGPALSMDRLEITYGSGRALLISPADKAGFLAALRRRAPRLRT